MLIQTLPPRRMWRVIAIRADSIWRLVTYAGSSAWMPYSPNTTLVPPLAAPERLGWCCLRCLTLRGISMTQPSLGASVLAGGGASVLAGAVGSAAGASAAGPVAGAAALAL